MPKEGRHSDVDAAILHFIQKTHVKGMPMTLQAASEGNRNFQSLRIINSKAWFEMPRNYTVDAKGQKKLKSEQGLWKAACNGDTLHNC